MAGYKKPDGLFTNATTFNDQIERQREKYQEKNDANLVTAGLGVGSSTQSTFPKFEADKILQASIDEFRGLDLLVNNTNGNPDFFPRVPMNSGESASIYSKLSTAEDKPNKKGPNLVPPDLNKLIQGSIEAGSDEPVGAENDKSRGYGWSDARNDEGTAGSTIGQYFRKHYNAVEQEERLPSPTLGEANDQGPEDPVSY